MKKTKSHNTIFDDVFRTMAQKMPQLLIPVINEAFQADYTEADYCEQLRNEYVEQYGKGITDSVIRLRNKLYHLECQSTEDSTMSVRMIEYDFAIALEKMLNDGKPYEMYFPNSGVLYLRHTEKTPDSLRIKVNLPQGDSFIYTSKIIKVQHYTKDEIFQKKLLLFLPYYIMRYEKELPYISSDKNKFNQFISEYESIHSQLETELYEDGKSILYEDLIVLIRKIANYMVKSKKVRERFGDVMGGKVLELESERLLRIGRQEGRKLGRQEGALVMMIAMYRDGKVTLDEASNYLGISVEEFKTSEQTNH